jgi:hypothetical protein
VTVSLCRSPADYRRRHLNAVRGEQQMWENLARLYGRSTLTREDGARQERIRKAWLER